MCCQNKSLPSLTLCLSATHLFPTMGTALLAFSTATAEMWAKALCRRDASQHIFHLQVDNMFNLERLQGEEASVCTVSFPPFSLGAWCFYLSTDLQLRPVSTVSGCWPTIVKRANTHFYSYMIYCGLKTWGEKKKTASSEFFIVHLYWLYEYMLGRSWDWGFQNVNKSKFKYLIYHVNLFFD